MTSERAEERAGTWMRCRLLAKTEGPAPALRELYAALGPDSPWGLDGYAVLPTTTPDPATAVLAATLEFDSGDLAVWHDDGRRDSDPEPVVLGVAWIRVGLTERLLRFASEYVAGRRTGGAPLSSVSAVRTMIGEITADLVEASLLLEHDGDAGAPRAMAATERALRIGLRLLGASGFLNAEPARLARAVDFLGDIYHSNLSTRAEVIR